MENFNFVFLLRDDNSWNQLFSHIENLKKSPKEIGNITVVVISTALLSCLQCTNLETHKEAISRLSDEGVQFFLCINTMSRYGIDEKMLLPEIAVAHEGGLMKTAKFESMGYHLVTLG